MDARATSRVTLTVLTVMTLVAAALGVYWSFAPLPEAKEQPPCVETQIADGQEVFPDQVVVSVFNSSGRNGLASRTMNGLTDRGFVGARTGNVPDEGIRGVQIWADSAKNPAVALVRAQFRKAEVTEGAALGPGVVVVLGNGNASMRPSGKAPTSRRSKGASTICSPFGATEITAP